MTHPGGRPVEFTDEQKRLFCQELARSGKVSVAADLAGSNRHTVYYHLRKATHREGRDPAALAFALRVSAARQAYKARKRP